VQELQRQSMSLGLSLFQQYYWKNYICLGIVSSLGNHVFNIVSCQYVGNPNLGKALVANKVDLDSKWKIEVKVELLFFGPMFEFITW
jgi:hypothetical protein